MKKWAEEARLPEYQVLGKGAVSADNTVGQGVWLIFQKKTNGAPADGNDSMMPAPVRVRAAGRRFRP